HITADTGPACFRLAFRAPGGAATWTAGWANLRTRLFSLPYGDQGLIISRKDYTESSGYPDQPLMEDVAMARQLRKITLLPVAVRTGAEKYIAQGWMRRGARNIILLCRYLLGADPHSLFQSYYNSRP
ncbi:MAG: glycosyl transferase, partial [Pseudomonadota bacterium]